MFSDHEIYGFSNVKMIGMGDKEEKDEEEIPPLRRPNQESSVDPRPIEIQIGTKRIQS